MEEGQIIRLKELEPGFERGKGLLLPTTTSLNRGEMVALVGRNGSGKSTLLKTIAGILHPLKGQVSLQNKDINSIDKRELSRKLSFVGTSLQAIENMSVYELVALGRHPYTNWWGSLGEADDSKIEESLDFVDMLKFREVPVGRLSDGERQRVLIASALAQDTEVILLDEPTAFLDIPNKLTIAEVLYRLKLSGKTVLYSTHDFESALNYSDKLWVLHEKELLAGAPEDLGLANAYQRLYEESGVEFDEVNLRFKRKLSEWKPIYMDFKEEKVYHWTRRALERISYQRSTDKDLAIRVEIQTGVEEFTWIVTNEGSTTSYNNLYELTAYLTQVR